MAVKIRNEFYKPVNEYKTTIFLCGAAWEREDMFRFRLRELLSKDKYASYYYDLIIPEYLFADLLFDPNGKDLISLENMLAYSVDVIVIVPESEGSLGELSLFIGNANLRSNIVCVLDKKYKRSRSYTSRGPLKLLKSTNNKAVIFADPNNLHKSLAPLKSVVREIKKKSTKTTNEIYLLQLENFILPAIFILEPIPHDTLEKMVTSVIWDVKNTDAATSSTISGLMMKRYVELTGEGYRLTNRGLKSFEGLNISDPRNKNIDKIIAFDELRLEIFNMRYRNKKLRV